MKNWKKIALGISGLALMSASLFTVSMAWYQSLNKASINGEQGYTASAYFAGGDGSSASPYVINQPIHLYNLAWLQYLGYFNQTKDGAYKQTYFVLGADLNMSTSTINWTLPPIGTTDNPFIGNFDGGGYTISNLVVDNTLGDGHITRKPSIISSITGVNIVGTFGVIGNYNLSSSFTYDSATNAIKDFKLNDAEVKSSLSDTLIGVAAGYVNATIANVGILNSKITIASGSTALSGGPTTNISDYSTVGYCSDAYKTTRNISDTTIKAPTTTTSHFTAPETGQASGWGGSIDMQSMYSRLGTIFDSTTVLDLSTVAESETVTTTISGTISTTVDSYYSGSFRQYYDSATPLKGSYCFSRFDSSDSYANYRYLYGKKEFPTAITYKSETSQTVTGYRISSNSHYLTNSGTSGITSTTNAGSAAIWIIPANGSSGPIYTTISNTLYYLGGTATWYGSASLTLSTTETTWTRSNNSFHFSYTSTDFWGETTTVYYLSYNSRNANFTLSTNSANMTLTVTSTTSIVVTTTGTGTTVGATTYDTYFPLNVGTDSTDSSTYQLPIATNTGYVVGGSNFNYSSYYKSGDIRVSQYAMSDLSNALNSSTYNSSGSNLEVVTRTANSGGFVRVSDDYNASNTAGTTLSSAYSTKTPYGTLGLQKYEKSRTSLHKVLSASGSSVYGLHFMDADISIDNLATASVARVRKTDYTNYQMPRDSIDFNLQERGYINFFSGSYFPGNDSFFSLHEIIRDSATQTITSIKRISKVYGTSSPSDPFIYLYDDGAYSGTLTSAYSEVFDMAWIMSPTIITNAMYYFEIPVNSGEYALGSVSGGTGAYLVYLDISANAQEVNRTAVTEYILIVNDTYEYPLGVSLIALATDTVDPLTGVAVALSGSYSGSMTLTKADSTITLTSTSDAFSPGWKGDAITLARSGSSDPPSVVPKSSSTSEIKRLTYIDYNTTTQATTYTIITSTDGTMTYTDGNGTAITSFTDSTGATVETSSVTSVDVTGLDDALLTYWYSYSADKSTITVTFAFTHTQDTANTDLHVDKVTGYTITLATTSEALTINATYLDGAYAVTINGTTVVVGTAISVPTT